MRLGTPGNEKFPYLVEVPGEDSVIVYAYSMLSAVRLFRIARGKEPHQIRQMSDNE